VFAELLLRRPLFAGDNYLHQLQLITEVLGTPSVEDLAFVRAPAARAFMSRLPRCAGVPLASLLPPWARGQAADLLQRMLRFDPARRASVEECLAHPFLARVREARRGVSEDAQGPPPARLRLLLRGDAAAAGPRGALLSVEALKARFLATCSAPPPPALLALPQRGLEPGDTLLTAAERTPTAAGAAAAAAAAATAAAATGDPHWTTRDDGGASSSGSADDDEDWQSGVGVAGDGEEDESDEATRNFFDSEAAARQAKAAAGASPCSGKRVPSPIPGVPVNMASAAVTAPPVPRSLPPPGMPAAPPGSKAVAAAAASDARRFLAQYLTPAAGGGPGGGAH